MVIRKVNTFRVNPVISFIEPKLYHSGELEINLIKKTDKLCCKHIFLILSSGMKILNSLTFRISDIFLHLLKNYSPVDCAHNSGKWSISKFFCVVQIYKTKNAQLLWFLNNLCIIVLKLKFIAIHFWLFHILKVKKGVKGVCERNIKEGTF